MCDRSQNRFWVGVLALTVSLSLVSSSCSAGEEFHKNDGVRTVYLIRHGDYDHDDERDLDIGKALVPLGVAHARIVGARLRGMPVEMSSLHSSTMTRARQTALVIDDEFPELELETPDWHLVKEIQDS